MPPPLPPAIDWLTECQRCGVEPPVGQLHAYHAASGLCLCDVCSAEATALISAAPKCDRCGADAGPQPEGRDPSRCLILCDAHKRRSRAVNKPCRPRVVQLADYPMLMGMACVECPATCEVVVQWDEADPAGPLTVNKRMCHACARRKLAELKRLADAA